MRRFSFASKGQARFASTMKTVLGIGATMFAVGCSGGGCSSCSGSSVIPGGFPKDSRITNAAGVRVTRPGLDFLQQNLGPIVQKVMGSGTSGGIMSFNVPDSSGSTTGVKYEICPGGPDPSASPPKCVAEIDVKDINNVAMEADKPTDLIVHATVPIRLQDLPLKVTLLIIPTSATACLTNDSAPGKWVDVPITADISLENIPVDGTHDIRAGYTKINIKSVTIDNNGQALKDNFHFCGGSFTDTVFNALKGLIVGNLVDGITKQLTGPLQSATCMKAQALPDGTEQCPTGTVDDGGTCRYTKGGECVPMLLGMESRFDLSGLLASISPGTKGGLDFLLASGGDMDPAPGTGAADDGMTLHMLGGALPQPISPCVPPAPNDLPTITELPAELSDNSISPWPASPAPAPHLGIGIAEKFLNYAATSAYNSGLLCIGVSSEQVSQLDAGLFSLLIPSMGQLADKFSASDTHPAMALSIRPQKPPKIVIGDNTDDFKSPLIGLTMPQTDLDFYMWSENRFVRLFTGTIDIGVPINLEAGTAGIQIKLPPKNPISFTNGKVTNNTLLLEDDATLANVVEGIGGVIPASTFNNIKPISLDSALSSVGLKLSIPKEGIRKVTSSAGDNFLGIFASLEVATSAVPTTITTAKITRFEVDPANYVLKTFGKHPAEIYVHAESSEDLGSKHVEYAYQVDTSAWTTFDEGRDFRIVSPFLNLQGKHTVKVVSRIVGVPESQGDAVTLPFVIDTIAPIVKVVNAEPGRARIVASDYVSASKDLKVEARIDGGAWTEVKPTVTRGAIADRVVEYAADASTIEVRATDEGGNVGSTSSALIRGRADTIPGAAASACGCSTPGGDGAGGKGALWLLSLGAVGAIVERRRRRNRARELAAATLFVSGAGSMGCSCGGANNVNGPTADPRPPVVSYVIGSYTSAATGSDGTVWVAGYNEGDPSTGDPNDFAGDLVVGKLGADGTVAWTAVDGVPTDSSPTKNPNGFRGGVTDPGDDVGLFTSIVLDGANHPTVAYFDRTNSALRVAHFDGSAWKSHQVDSVTTGWAGKYTSITLVNGNPVVAYQTVEAGDKGWARAKVRIARATSAVPASASDWTFEDAVVEQQTPCFADTCASGSTCLAPAAGIDPVCAQNTTGCDSTCADACVASPADGKPACLKAKPVFAGYPNAIGVDISLAADASGNLGVVFYDRPHGNLRGATDKGGAWTSTPASSPIDGWTGDVTKDKGRGDRGIGATLAIDGSGNWHVAYSDGIQEWLLYMMIPGGDFTKVGAPVIVDDGLTLDGTPTNKFADGQHVVGENANLTVDASGMVHIVYQDSTGGTLRWAKGQGGATATFTRGAITQDGFGGFWPKIVGAQAVNFFRAKGTTQGDPDAGFNGDPVVVGNVRALPLP